MKKLFLRECMLEAEQSSKLCSILHVYLCKDAALFTKFSKIETQSFEVLRAMFLTSAVNHRNDLQNMIHGIFLLQKRTFRDRFKIYIQILHIQLGGRHILFVEASCKAKVELAIVVVVFVFYSRIYLKTKKA